MIPLSRKESWSARLPLFLPNRKLSVTNCRSSSLSGISDSFTIKMINILVHKKLRGDNTYQAHIVLDADGGAPPELVKQLFHRLRVEDSVAPDPGGRQQFL